MNRECYKLLITDFISYYNAFNYFSVLGVGNGNLLQCSCLENPRDSGAQWAAFYGVAQSRTRLN